MPTPKSKSDLNGDSAPNTSSPRQNSVAGEERGAPSRARGLADRVLSSILPGIRSGQRRAVQAEPDSNEPPELLDLVLSGPDAIVVVHRDNGEIIEANARFCDWLGSTRDFVVGQTVVSLFGEPEIKLLKKLYTDGGSGGVVVVEVPSSGPNIAARLIEFTSSISPLGHGQFATLIGRDIGERAVTERYLRSERDRMNAIIRSMRDILVMMTSTGDIEYANPAAEQAFEPYELPIVCHRWSKAFAKQDKADLQGLTSAYEGQTLELEATNGRVFLVTRSFLFESTSRAKVMLMAKDITDQRIVEKQNHQLEIELMRETKLAEFGMLSAGVAHNLRGPLTGILGCCDLLEMKNMGGKEITQIQHQALTMSAIISNLMNKSRNEQETEPQPLILEEVVRTELQFLDANLFFKHNVEKVVDLETHLPTIHGVYGDLSQVVGNLLRNAIDAMHDREQRLITVRLWKEDKHILFAVTDTGCGISDDNLKRLFTPFFTTKPKAGEAQTGTPTGTGLGLSTSRSILARFGAEIHVDSKSGRGSTFTIKFPLNRKYSTTG